ncbi:GntR family transcriptional regulator [Vibrio chagasii]|uniref:GntR family transcriptional regulator n=1 Tax=Vibrio chagasii TaxID=170679 RepID=UPI001EFEA44B|nr:GntR family transcriptional regulator [Vibrio chagasii]MCG9560144.1 GntR family transcriptional regulator [Vibrio chagasii]CAH7221899.1 GntR family transcriptional regulator [Vibrio chagasii]CAH7244115.1 GntR family transcriptional regulator [Vibrio chagasii]CAH7410668.1 GntR family transcriptional regulator [Vibrio chagasii]
MKKYELVVQDIVSKICQNSINHKLPAERELSEIYGLSRFTIRKALAKLEAIGMVTSKVGSGYFVNTALIGTPLVYNSITENSFEEISYKKIQLNKALPDNHEQQIFSLSDNEYIWKIRRLRLINNKVVQIEEAKIPVSVFPEMNAEIIESSIQKHALSKGLQIDSYLTTYQAVNVSKEDAELLGCKKNVAAMNITNRGFLSSGELFIVSDIIDINYQCTYHTPFNRESMSYRDKK